MRKLFGFLLLLTGLGFGLFAYYPGALDREAHLAEVTEIIAAPAGDVSRRVPETTGAIRTFSPGVPMTIEKKPSIAPARPSVTEVAKAKPSTTASPAPTVAAPQAAAPRAAPVAPLSTGWEAVVAAEASSVPSGVTSSKPGDSHARYELVVDIQRELKRAGCYGGTLSGSWNAITKRAMSEFMRRVNASLPAEEPDYILLTLVKGHTSASCITCPLGQTVVDGRCVANTQIAQKPKADERKDNKDKRRFVTAPAEVPAFTTTVRPAVPETKVAARPPPELPGRMSVGGPKAAEFGPPPASTSWSVKIVPTPRKPTSGAEAAGGGVRAPGVSGAGPVAAPRNEAGRTNTAALQSGDDWPVDSAAVDEPSAQAPPPGPVPRAGLAGTKSGRATSLGTSPAAASPTARPVYAVPNAKPRRTARPAPSPRPAKRYGGRSGTRSVQSLFMHPLGRM